MKPLILAVMLSFALPAHAQTLRDDDHITGQLVAAQVGDMLRTTCPKVSARMFVVFSEMFALKSYAQAKGHSDADIKAFLQDKDEKKRIRDLAASYLAEIGFDKSDVEGACAIARAEVANGTVTGGLIWVTK